MPTSRFRSHIASSTVTSCYRTHARRSSLRPRIDRRAARIQCFQRPSAASRNSQNYFSRAITSNTDFLPGAPPEEPAAKMAREPTAIPSGPFIEPHKRLRNRLESRQGRHPEWSLRISLLPLARTTRAYSQAPIPRTYTQPEGFQQHNSSGYKHTPIPNASDYTLSPPLTLYPY